MRLVSLALLAALLGCHHPAAPQPEGPPTLTLGPDILHQNVIPFGINLSGQTFYDSGQMLRNLIFRNPGFEGQTWQSILRCKSVTPTTCTDQNPYAQWPASFLTGATFEVLSGPARGTTGTVTASAAADGTHGVTLTLAAPNLHPNDFLLVRLDKPGTPAAGWWPDLKNGATLTPESHDLSPATPGRQALRVDALASNQTAALSSYFDSYAGHSFLQLRGHYTLAFRARALAGTPAVHVEIKRLDTTHGPHIFLDKQVPLSTQWHDYRFDFTAAELPPALGTVGLTFTFNSTTALLDDASLEEAAAPNNPTAFRNAVVSTLRDLHPGALRYMDNGTNFGSSLDNMLAPPFARQRSGSSTQETLHEDIPIGLPEFLQLCQAIGAEPWYTMPPGTSPAEAAHLAQYLAPWTKIFPVIHLELGNEQWNNRSFAGSTLNDPTAYAERAQQVFAALRAAPGFRPEKFDLILGSWATVPWYTQQQLRSVTAEDSVALAPYLFSDFNDASSTEAIFGPMFAEPERIDSRPTGYMAQQRAAASSKRLAIYETNLGTTTGTATQAQINSAIPSLGAGLAVADHMLLMLRDLGITTQCLFALPEYVNGFTTPGRPKQNVPLWGAVVDMGGATSARRPQFLALQAINHAILPTMLATHLTGDPTWNQPLSSNAQIELPAAHLLQTFAFADGPRRSLIILNLSRTNAIPLRLAGPDAPTGPVTQTLLTAPDLSSTNEQTPQVTLQTQHLPHFNPTLPYSLPPHSLTVLTWQTTY